MTEEAVQRQRAEVAEARPGWYWWVVMIATVVMASGASVWISVKNTERSERKLCTVIISIDVAYRQAPPTTATGRNIARNIADARQRLGCPDKEN